MEAALTTSKRFTLSQPGAKHAESDPGSAVRLDASNTFSPKENSLQFYYENTWRNGWGPYTQVARIDELPEKLRQLLERYGECFDDSWWIGRSTRGRGKGLWVRRVPIWQTTKKMPAEKHRPHPVLRGQKRLVEAPI